MERRTLLKAGVVAPAAAVAAAALPAPAEARPRLSRTLASGLSYPWGIDFLPDGTGLVTERNSGKVLRVRPGGGAAVVGRLPDAFNDGGEGGLMGVAVSPRFARDRWVYFFLTTTSDNRIVRVRFVDGALSGAPQPILTGIPSGSTHNGGGLWFTRHPSLFATTGDTRNSALAQNRNSLAGKVLRMRLDGSPQAGNPFGNRVYSYGHRNVEGITVGRTWPDLGGRARREHLGRAQPDPSRAQLRLAAGRGLRRGRRLPRPAGPVAHRRRVAERRHDVEGPRLGRCPARREPVVGRHLGPGRAHQAPLLPGHVRPDPQREASAGQVLVDHHEQRRGHRPGAPDRRVRKPDLSEREPRAG